MNALGAAIEEHEAALEDCGRNTRASRGRPRGLRERIAALKRGSRENAEELQKQHAATRGGKEALIAAMETARVEHAKALEARKPNTPPRSRP